MLEKSADGGVVMGNKSSVPAVAKDELTEGSSTMVRAIARGRVYVAIRYPAAVETLAGTLFNEHQFREVLANLQQVCFVSSWCVSGGSQSECPEINQLVLLHWVSKPMK